MDYEIQEVEVVVDVPMEDVKTTTGYRYDKHLGSKIVQVEEDHHYEMRPVRVAKGETRVKDHPDNYEHYGKAVHGAPDWDAVSNFSGSVRPDYKYNRSPGTAYAASTMTPRAGASMAAGPTMSMARAPMTARARPRSAGSTYS